MTNNPIKIAIVDDQSIMQKLVIDKLKYYPDIHLKHVASKGEEIRNFLESFPHLDLILMDIEMPSENGVEVTQFIKTKYPHIKILMLTVFDDSENIFSAIQAGAEGYLLKDISRESLYKGIVDTMNGGAAMTPSIALKTLKLLKQNTSTQKANLEFNLSQREISVLEQLSTGLNYKQIASNLVVSPSTVRKHIENIYKKLRVHSKIEAVTLAKNNGII